MTKQKRQMLIVESLMKRDSSQKEIMNYICQKENNFLEPDRTTFYQDVKDIEKNWGIYIEYDFKKRKYVLMEKELPLSFHKMQESYNLIKVIESSNKHDKSFLVEKSQEFGIEYFQDVLDAIENKYIINFRLKSYCNEHSKRRCVPIAIKEANKRWYLIAYDLDKKDFRNYGLDRVDQLRIGNEKSSYPTFDVEKAYEHSIGIENYGEPIKITLKFDYNQINYLKSLPIHFSQKIIDEKDGYFWLELFVYPTYELKMEILKRGAFCEVIQPDFFRNEIKDEVNKMYQFYHD